MRTNRRTGGIFRTQDYTPSELASQTRRFHCARCEAMLGEDVAPGVAQIEAQTTGHEVAGSPITTFVTRAELNEHVRRVHGGLRRADTATRRIGRSRRKSENLLEEDGDDKEGIGGERNFLDGGGGVLDDDDNTVTTKKKRRSRKDTTIDDEPFSVDEDKDTVFQEEDILGDDSATGEDTAKEGEFFP